MEVATRIVVAATFDEVNAGRHHVVTVNGHARRWMCKAAFLLFAIARTTQKLATHLTKTHAIVVLCGNTWYV